MGTFRLSPEETLREGKNQVAHAGEMRHLTTELYNQVDELLKTGYTSPGAREIYEKIVAKKVLLDGMAKTFNNYGNYMIRSTGQTVNVDEDIANNVKFE